MKDEIPHGILYVVQALRVLALCLLVAAVLSALLPRTNAAEAVQTFAPGRTEARMLIPMGRTVGIKLFSDGVLVVGLSEIGTENGASNPAKDCGLREGDIITHINSSEVDTIEQVQTILQGLEGEEMSIRAMRGERQIQMTVKACRASEDGTYKLGAWIRDSMAGIGTMTFYDPETGEFGALGHGISDVDTSQLMPLQSGGIMFSSVKSVKKGMAGFPGELRGAFRTEADLGTLASNTDSGIFGTLKVTECFDLGDPIPVAPRREILTGPAVILSNIDGEAVEEYTVEITKLYSGNGTDTRDMMIRITDPRLLEKTGGIVQGMSGSPILQNGRLVGAVTHVLVNDPTSGYGILTERMLRRCSESNLDAVS